MTLALICTDAIVGGLDLFSRASDEEWGNRGKALGSRILIGIESSVREAAAVCE